MATYSYTPEFNGKKFFDGRVRRFIVGILWGLLPGSFLGETIFFCLFLLDILLLLLFLVFRPYFTYFPTIYTTLCIDEDTISINTLGIPIHTIPRDQVYIRKIEKDDALFFVFSTVPVNDLFMYQINRLLLRRKAFVYPFTTREMVADFPELFGEFFEEKTPTQNEEQNF